MTQGSLPVVIGAGLAGAVVGAIFALRHDNPLTPTYCDWFADRTPQQVQSCARWDYAFVLGGAALGAGIAWYVTQ